MTTPNIKTEDYTLTPHSPDWKDKFEAEKSFLRSYLPSQYIGPIEHIGSTAIQGIKAKPIIDMLMQVTSQDDAKTILGPALTQQGYTHIIHRGLTSDEPAESSWFVKRDDQGARTHHIWCAEANTPVRNRVRFVQYCNDHPDIATQYEALKLQLLQDYPGQRRKYLAGKSDFINRITTIALQTYGPCVPN